MWGSQPFYFGDSISVGVRDLQRSIEWYKEKLKLQLTRFPSEDYDALLSFDKEDEMGLVLALIPLERPKRTSKNIRSCLREKSKEPIRSFRGIEVGPIQWDSGGNQFFEFYDLDGNKIEVCGEP